MKKNADMPAMPLSFEVKPSESDGESLTIYYEGLTKREMFAMNAPEIPGWFIDEWLYNNGDYRLGGVCELVGSNGGANVSLEEMKKITKEWRYAYADLMLEDK